VDKWAGRGGTSDGKPGFADCGKSGLDLAPAAARKIYRTRDIYIAPEIGARRTYHEHIIISIIYIMFICVCVLKIRKLSIILEKGVGSRDTWDTS
jgi:hypothetical protein